MGTRSNTVIYDDDVQILNMYRQHDGYLIGHGAELLAFLEPMTIVNGFTMGATNIANGAGCLAAQMVAHFKVRVGGIYIQSRMGELENDYTYDVVVKDDVILLTVFDFEEIIFSGTIPEFKQFIKEYTE
jgi:hypothetical protein